MDGSASPLVEFPPAYRSLLGGHLAGRDILINGEKLIEFKFQDVIHASRLQEILYHREKVVKFFAMVRHDQIIQLQLIGHSLPELGIVILVLGSNGALVHHFTVVKVSIVFRWRWHVLYLIALAIRRSLFNYLRLLLLEVLEGIAIHRQKINKKSIINFNKL